MTNIEQLMKKNVGGELNPIQDSNTLISIIRSQVYSDIYVSPDVCISEQNRFEASVRENRLIIKKDEFCHYSVGAFSVETCWGDIDIRTFKKFKKQGAKYCPYCGRGIKEVGGGTK